MLRIQQHRGPDDSGLATLTCGATSAVFGHRRLSIIDLSAGGHQPMTDPLTGNWITFNGEIYNYRELRDELIASGHEFRTSTDTEVILKSYAEWGVNCASHLRGIFAFAIWDRNRDELVAFRDHLGVKPFYYWRDAIRIVFASEVRAILATDLVPRAAEIRAIQSYLAYGSVQDPYSIVQNVFSLEPGHVLRWQRGETSISPYWKLPGSGDVAGPPDLAELRCQLLDAVHSQLVADVPLGAFLSGGIDSTAIVALMKRSGAEPLQTFSVVFDEARYDERKYSKLASSQIGTTHTELLLTGSDVRASMPQALASFDQPSVDGLNTYFVSRATKEAGLTVALSGLGGDEVFAGYDGFHKALLAERWGLRANRMPFAIRRAASFALRAMPFGGEKIRKADELLGSSLHPYFSSRRLFNSSQCASLLAGDLVQTEAGWQPGRFRRIETETLSYDPINRASAFELQTYMLSTLLRDTDQMSMAHALEVRVPFLDHRLVEYVARMPGRTKVIAGQQKPLLTLALGNDIPGQCIHRPKQGFELPISIWLQTGMREECEASFMTPRQGAASPFSALALQRLWMGFQRKKIGWSRVWAVFVLRDWMRRHQIAV